VYLQAALLASVAFACASAPAQPAAAAAQAQAAGDEMIVTLRSNGVARGEFTVLQMPDGEFWVAADDLPRLKVKPLEQARRQAGGVTYYSLQALGAGNVRFDAALLALALDFPSTELEGTHIDLSNRPPPLPIVPPPGSAILNYRAAVRQAAEDAPVHLRLATELNVRIGEVLLRQEAKYDSGLQGAAFSRGTTQLIWDDRLAGRRVIAGDQITHGGPFGTAVPAAGVSLSRVFAITPDVVRQPGPSLQVSAATPSQVEVAVDGSPVYRTTVPPGPVALDNLVHYGGARNVRVTVTDAAGRREIYDQPFFFTDSVLAKGLHEYSYFLGRRAELGFDDRWRYREAIWQGFHRYGMSDRITVEAGGEGNGDFASGGAGVTLRNDVLGLLSLGALGSSDRATGRSAQGWSARYTYVAPRFTAHAARRQLEPGFRTLGDVANSVALLSETRLGFSTQLFPGSNLSADYTRTEESIGTRSNYALRLSSSVSRHTTIYAEYNRTRTATDKLWGVNVYLRIELERDHWAGTAHRASRGSRVTEFEVGKQLGQGEGVGYRAGTILTQAGSYESDVAYASATWALKPVTLDFNGTAQVRGGRGRYLEVGASGALVSVDGYVGATRPVSDGFALARLGVPQAGVHIFLNSQVQGKTDAEGNLLIPNVGAFGRQDVTLDDKQLAMDYTLGRKKVTIAPAYKSGTLVRFGGRKLRALTGQAWLVEGSARKPVELRSWNVQGPGGRLRIDTAPSGDFYLEDAPPGRYTGRLEANGRVYSCTMNIPTFTEAVHELQQGLLCE